MTSFHVTKIDCPDPSSSYVRPAMLDPRLKLFPVNLPGVRIMLVSQRRSSVEIVTLSTVLSSGTHKGVLAPQYGVLTPVFMVRLLNTVRTSQSPTFDIRRPLLPGRPRTRFFDLMCNWHWYQDLKPWFCSPLSHSFFTSLPPQQHSLRTGLNTKW